MPNNGGVAFEFAAAPVAAVAAEGEVGLVSEVEVLKKRVAALEADVAASRRGRLEDLRSTLVFVSGAARAVAAAAGDTDRESHMLHGAFFAMSRALSEMIDGRTGCCTMACMALQDGIKRQCDLLESVAAGLKLSLPEKR